MNDRLIKRRAEERRKLAFDFCFLLFLTISTLPLAKSRPVAIVNAVLSNSPTASVIQCRKRLQSIHFLCLSPLSLPISLRLLICNANFLFYELAQLRLINYLSSNRTEWKATHAKWSPRISACTRPCTPSPAPVRTICRRSRCRRV